MKALAFEISEITVSGNGVAENGLEMFERLKNDSTPIYVVGYRSGGFVQCGGIPFCTPYLTAAKFVQEELYKESGQQLIVYEL